MIYVIAIILHFVFGWILQDRNIAKTKSKKLNSLYIHIFGEVTAYLTILFLIAFWHLVYFVDDQLKQYLLLVVLFGLIFINIASHAVLDWWLPRLFKPETSERRMVDMVAVDAMLHLSILIGSIHYYLILVN